MTTFKFSTGYDDCLSCGGAGVLFIAGDMETPSECPECHQRDVDFEEVWNLDYNRPFGSEVQTRV